MVLILLQKLLQGLALGRFFLGEKLGSQGATSKVFLERRVGELHECVTALQQTTL